MEFTLDEKPEVSVVKVKREEELHEIKDLAYF